MKKIQLLLAMILVSLPFMAREIRGNVVSADGQALQDAVISASGVSSVLTDEQGRFTIDVPEGARLSVWADGYFNRTVRTGAASELRIVLLSTSTYKYSQTSVLPYRIEEKSDIPGATSLNKKDFALGAGSIDRAVQGEFAGLQVTQKSGMPGEGASFLLHGLQTLSADARPLVVINGVPYMPSTDESQLIGGYSRSLFQAYSLNDIQNITLLTGAEAALYGSLGSNGVLLIETDGATSDDMNTKISYNGAFGVNWNSSRIPLMSASQYKSYLSDIGMTYFDNMETFFSNFPFLYSDQSGQAYSYLYRFDTDWQNELYRSGMTTDHLVRVEGGDAIAKYDISVGYMHDEGTLKNTSQDRFSAQINSNVLVSKKVEIATSIGLAYLDGSYQEQGMIPETNPLLAAYRRSPVLSPYKSDMYGSLLDSYASYYYGNNTNTDFIVSNPSAIINTLSADMRQYDVNMNARLSYRPNNYLSFNGMVGLYYNYDQEGIFIPGINNHDIVPQFDTYGQSDNIVRQGVNETLNWFAALNAAYSRSFGEHQLTTRAGTQMMLNKFETDMGVGRNTANDFYQTLSDVQTVGRFFSGYGSRWNWMNIYLQGAYTYADLLNLGLMLSADGASSTGKDATRMGLFPAVSATFMLTGLDYFKDIRWLDRLHVHADYGKTGNSRFSGNYGKYYYSSRLYQNISGIVRNNVPNTKIKWEEVGTANLGLDASLLDYRMSLGLNYFNKQATDVLMTRVESSLYGTGLHYSNDAEIGSHGLDISLKLAPVYTRDFKWVLGGNITRLHNTVKSLGTADNLISTLSDGATIVTRPGEAPYSFYGYETDADMPVYATTLAARTAYSYVEGGETKTRPMLNRNGVEYEAGDVNFVDQNGDGIIDDADRVVLGSATPDWYGGLFTRLQYKAFALDFNFVYSLGNEAYNAVRRVTESARDFSNQSLAVNRRWTMDGQKTDMPRAVYGDLVGNNDFSDRWIEDASYIKLRDVTLSYSFDHPVWHFFQGGTIYVTGQNLLCLTGYLGQDPEFAYSYNTAMTGVDYAKLAAPKTVKVGVNLKF
ncbi:MAG: SusC/RagA family TonB-linked outer membrane protein [Bacteroidales bacterium]|nr:SusC/RagA family TonB-linked outer membrane protein [Bacteroidales bacterium]